MKAARFRALSISGRGCGISICARVNEIDCTKGFDYTTKRFHLYNKKVSIVQAKDFSCTKDFTCTIKRFCSYDQKISLVQPKSSNRATQGFTCTTRRSFSCFSYNRKISVMRSKSSNRTTKDFSCTNKGFQLYN